MLVTFHKGFMFFASRSCFEHKYMSISIYIYIYIYIYRYLYIYI